MWVIGLRCVGKLAEVYTVDIGANVCSFYYRQSTVCSQHSQLFVHTFHYYNFFKQFGLHVRVTNGIRCA